MSIIIEVNGKSVTPEEAARALNQGPVGAVVAADREGGPEVTVYGRDTESGTGGPLELRCDTFRASTAREVREYEHVLSIAADLIALADLTA